MVNGTTPTQYEDEEQEQDEKQETLEDEGLGLLPGEDVTPKVTWKEKSRRQYLQDFYNKSKHLTEIYVKT